MSGRQLAEEVARHRPASRSCTSGYTDNASCITAASTGVLLLTKPYRKSQLAKMVRQALKGQASTG
jgi:hypothetical protein